MKEEFRKIHTVKFLFLVFTALLALPSFAQEPPFTPAYWTEDSELTLFVSRGFGYSTSIVSSVGAMMKNNDDVCVTLRLAKERGLPPGMMADAFNQKGSWMAVCKSLTYHPSEFFKDTDFCDYLGAPGRFKAAYKKYHTWMKDPEKEIDLTDDEIRDLVIMRMVVKLFGVTPNEVMKARNSGRDWTQIILNQGR